jgi:glycosyltransferase involved in cell wall biosynthesis
VTVGHHAPPPGSKTGIADYAEALERGLRQIATSAGGDIRRGAGSADIHLYHLGNNRLHEAIYAQALVQPGVVVLHDAVLNHFFLSTLNREQYISEWVYNYGEWQRDFGAEMWNERAGAAVDPRYFERPMLRRIVETSRAVVVHNTGAEAIARAHGARNVYVIPHLFEAQTIPDAVETIRFRESLGIRPGVRLFGIFGYLRETKRVMPAIAAFRRVHAVRPDTALLLAGEPVSGDLRRLLDREEYGGSEGAGGLIRCGHLDEGLFRIALAAVDCGINLRYPGAGETSGITIRLMGTGVPVMVTDCAENAGYPPQSAFRVRSGIAEAAELFDHIVLVTDFPAIARKVGREGCRHIAAHHSLERVARSYWEALCCAAS